MQERNYYKGVNNVDNDYSYLTYNRESLKAINKKVEFILVRNGYNCDFENFIEVNKMLVGNNIKINIKEVKNNNGMDILTKIELLKNNNVVDNEEIQFIGKIIIT